MLKIDSVQLEYGYRKILQDISISCQTGEIIGLLGRNGSGKSSLLKIIFGTLKPEYKYLNIDGLVAENGYLKNKVAYLPQFNFLPKSISICQLAKVLVDPIFWPKFADSDIYRAHRYQSPGNLSGGELRKLETLMIIFSKAKYILLDEPFTHISPVQADEIKDHIREIGKYKGVIVTDHQYQNILETSHRIILIHNGKTINLNSKEELIQYGYLSNKPTT